ncbi:hypothetical protein RF11_07206 [Thelohanellus kitauei]|uniref:Activin types I and II receptor domain-containing protein n=1 Tax=Thelohanellus kitauei TaxID=669202 RepID=A0A0C2MUM4_THEKT|nr:hypothetical protein RF11_07206 [Thelohanellus kitauei]
MLHLSETSRQDTEITCICPNCSQDDYCRTDHYCFSLAKKINETTYSIRRSCAYGKKFPISEPEFCDHEGQDDKIFIKCCFSDFCNNHSLSEILPQSMKK